MRCSDTCSQHSLPSSSAFYLAKLYPYYSLQAASFPTVYTLPAAASEAPAFEHLVKRGQGTGLPLCTLNRAPPHLSSSVRKLPCRGPDIAFVASALQLCLDLTPAPTRQICKLYMMHSQVPMAICIVLHFLGHVSDVAAGDILTKSKIQQRQELICGTGRLVQLSDQPVLCSAVSPDGSEAVFGCSDHALYTVDLLSCKKSRTLYGR